MEKNLKLLKNFSSLTAIQISNYIFPLITFPYLVRVLGVEYFGKANFVFAFIAYFVTFTEFGSRISATQQISIFKNNKHQLENIFNSTLIIKSLLSIIALMFFFLILVLFEKFFENYITYLLAFIFVIGYIISPDWFFLGIEKMIYISCITIPIRIITVISIFALVKSSDDLNWYITIISLSQLFIGFILILFVIVKYNIKFQIPSKYQLLRQFKKGINIYLSQLSINIYNNSNVFLLGILSGNIAVGYYTGANKIREAAQGIFTNMGTTIFPHYSDLLLKNKNKGIESLKKYLKLSSVLSLFVGLTIFFLSKEIILLILGPGYLNSIVILKILSFLPFIITLSNVLGIQIMLNTGNSIMFSRIITFAAILNIVLLFILIPIFKEKGVAITMLLVEIFVTINMGVFVIKKRLLK